MHSSARRLTNGVQPPQRCPALSICSNTTGMIVLSWGNRYRFLRHIKPMLQQARMNGGKPRHEELFSKMARVKKNMIFARRLHLPNNCPSHHITWRQLSHLMDRGHKPVTLHINEIRTLTT